MDSNIKPAGNDKYEAPTVTDYGDLTEVTAQGGTGSRADANIRIGQPVTFISS